MLNPRDRHLLLETLRPPPGYVLSQALGTSYSLDLLALLTAPLAFTFFDWEDQDGEITAEPLALLEAVRRHAAKISVFCHAGNVKVPPPSQRLLAYLERSVVEVLPTKEGAVFHPKIWVLRFERDDEPVHYRFLCLSRNLTFDRSWDTVLSIDGILEDRERGFARNRPLSDFIAALPALAVQPINKELAATVEQVAREIRRVKFESPEGVADFAFWPIGTGKGRTWPYPAGNKQALVISPFIAPGCLCSLADQRSSATLISRAEELAKIDPSVLSSYEKIFTLDSCAAMDDDPDASPGLSGLHAKLVVMDDGWNAKLFTGSANATDAAFNGNIEFMTELQGRKSRLGVDAVLGGSEKPGQALADLLQPWTASAEGPTAEEQLRERMERQLRIYVTRFVRSGLQIGIHADDGNYAMQMTCLEPLPACDEFSLVCWPSTLRYDDAVPVNFDPAEMARFSPVSLDAITGFIAFEAKLTSDSTSVRLRFVLNVPLDNEPADRMDRILAAMVGDQSQLIKLLWLLLQKDGDFAATVGVLTGAVSAKSTLTAEEAYPIFEPLVQSLSEGRERVDEIGRLLNDLRASPEGEALIPSGLYELWLTASHCADEIDGSNRSA